jgi:hypothetical protein
MSIPKSDSLIAFEEMAAASSRGYPNAPVEIDGKAIDESWY